MFLPFGYALHAGEAADGEEGDIPHFYPITHRRITVGQFVQGYAGKEEQGDGYTKERAAGAGPEGDTPAKGGPDQDQDEGDMYAYLDPLDAEEPQRPVHRRPPTPA